MTLLNLDKPVVVRVAHEPSHAICGHLVLEVNVRDGRAEVVRMESFVGLDMPQLDARTSFEVFKWMG